jgi:hypothetical protein
MIDFSKVDTTPINKIAISLLICIIVSAVITLIIGVVMKVLKIPNFLFNYIITFTVLISFFGMVYMVTKYFY